MARFDSGERHTSVRRIISQTVKRRGKEELRKLTDRLSLSFLFSLAVKQLLHSLLARPFFLYSTHAGGASQEERRKRAGKRLEGGT
jgi:hypothetical protein